jgi:hypothetical protein
VQDVLTGKLAGNLLRERFSAIYAFDLFVHNVDRHTGNYLFVGSRNANVTVRAFDFSRAWTQRGWPLPSLPLAPCNTLVHYRNTMKVHPFDMTAASALLDKIKAVPVSWVQTVHNEIPPPWLDKATRNAIVKWWSTGGDMVSRVDEIREGLKNGTYL